MFHSEPMKRVYHSPADYECIDWQVATTGPDLKQDPSAISLQH